MSRKKNLILALISNYQWDDIKVFFKSLEKTGFSDEVVVFCENISDDTQQMLRQLPYTVHLIPFYRHGLEYTFAIVDYRYYLFYNFLQGNHDRYDMVMVTDVRDVYFQSDPVKVFWDRHSITVAKESCEIGQEIFNSRWILSKFGYHTYSLLQNKTILCSGTTIGPSEFMVNYLKEMTASLFYDGYAKWTDQAVHNYLVYNGIVKPVSYTDNISGPIMTLAMEKDQNIAVNADDRILLRNGHPAPIVHQYNRNYHLVELINRLIP